MRDLDWKLLCVLHTCKNITKASELVHVTQPSITKRIQQIEDEFRVKIVNRSTKGITFTPQGEYLAKRAEQFLAFYDETKFTLLEMAEESQKTLTISAPNSYIGTSMPELLNGFKQKHEAVRFGVKAELSSQILSRVEMGSIDIGFVNGEIEGKPGILKTRVRLEDAFAVSRNPIELPELERFPRIEHNRDAMTLKIINNWWQEYFGQPPIIGMNVNHQATTIQMVENGFGYGILFASSMDSIPKELFRTQLVRKDGTPICRNTWMLYLKSYLKNPLLREFVDYVKKEKAFLN